MRNTNEKSTISRFPQHWVRAEDPSWSTAYWISADKKDADCVVSDVREKARRQHSVIITRRLATRQRLKIGARPDEVIYFGYDDPRPLIVKTEMLFQRRRDFHGVSRV
jgi:hypothetical protein